MLFRSGTEVGELSFPASDGFFIEERGGQVPMDCSKVREAVLIQLVLGNNSHHRLISFIAMLSTSLRALLSFHKKGGRNIPTNRSLDQRIAVKAGSP